MHILVTRPIAQALKTRERLEAFGHQVSLAPMLEILFPVDLVVDLDEVQAIAVTSANAVEGMVQRPDRDQLCDLPVFAVGDSTAQRAERAGWRKVHSAAGAVDDLAQLLQSSLSRDAGTILYAAGTDRAGDLSGSLGDAGFRVRIAEVYRARGVEHLPESVAEALRRGELDAIFVYSTRTAGQFLACIRSLDLMESLRAARICALSPAIAEPFRVAGCSNVMISGEPNERSLFADLQLQG